MGTTSPIETIRKAFQSVIITLLKIVTNLNILTYLKEKSGKNINHPSKTLNSISNMKKYFKGGFRPKKNVIFICPEMRIGFKIEEKNYCKTSTRCP